MQRHRGLPARRAPGEANLGGGAAFKETSGLEPGHLIHVTCTLSVCPLSHRGLGYSKSPGWCEDRATPTGWGGVHAQLLRLSCPVALPEGRGGQGWLRETQEAHGANILVMPP